MRSAVDRPAVFDVVAVTLVSLVAVVPGCGGGGGPDLEAKVTCQSPDEGKKPKRVIKWKYDVLRGAITEVISSSKDSPVPVDTLDEAVVDQLTAKGQSIEEIGNNMEWWTNLVLDDMEVRGAVKREVKDDAEFVKLK